MADTMTLKEALSWIFAGPGAGIIAYFAIAKIKFLAKLNSEYKRYVGIGLTSILAVGVWVLSMLPGYTPWPVGWVEWLEGAFAIGFAANMVALAVHGRVDLRARDKLAGR